MIRFTLEEKQWLKDNYPCNESRQATYERFCNKFATNHSLLSVVDYCKKHHINKPKERYKYQKGNKPWSTGLTKEEHKKHFSQESYNKLIANVNNFPNITNRAKYNCPKGYVLSDLGNGEFLAIEKSIHKCMQFSKTLGKGELTKAVYETYLVKREIEKIKGKRIMRNVPQNSKDYLAKIRPLSNEKTRIGIVAERDGKKRYFASLSEASRELNIPIGCISRVVNGLRSHTHHYKFYTPDNNIL